MNQIVNMKVTHGTDCIELWRFERKTGIRIVEIEGIYSQKTEVKKRTAWNVVAAPKDEQELTDLLNFVQQSSFNIQVIVTREVPAGEGVQS